MDDAQAAKLRALAEKTDRGAYARGQHLGVLIAPDELLALLDERDALRATIDRQMETCRIDTEQIGALQRERDAAMALLHAWRIGVTSGELVRRTDALLGDGGEV